MGYSVISGERWVFFGVVDAGADSAMLGDGAGGFEFFEVAADSTNVNA